jgi:cytochrome c oxidase subunit 2
MVMPDCISTYGAEVDWLFYLISAITGVLFVLVEVLLVVFLVRYRHREGRTKASNSHGNGRLEVAWSLATALVLVFIAFIQLKSWNEIKLKDFDGMAKDPNTFLVRAFGEQFEWYFVYPGPDGVWEKQSGENVTPGNPLGLENFANDKFFRDEFVVPADTNVVVELTSWGKYDANTGKLRLAPVLHSFFAPHLRLKQDLVPFYPGRVWFRVLKGKEGTYEIVCAELCGLGHSTMKRPFRVVSSEELARKLGYDWKGAGVKHPGGFPVPEPRQKAEIPETHGG